MNVVDTAQIYSFAPIAAQTDFVLPSEESAFILTSSQHQEIISRAVQKAIQSLQDEIRDLKATIARQDGGSKWTLRLLADKLVEMEVVDSISHMSVQRLLKKMKLNLG